ncbi:MAG: carbohydrate-binding domain-containing protein [Prevotella sp.]|nr:carbohydrate-binding domain-containing protein [Prevotella sp.]
MKKIFCSIMAMLTMAASAQTLNVTSGGATYQFPAEQTGKMTFANGSTMNVMGKTFAVGDITSMFTDDTAVSDNEVNVTYIGTGALVYVAGNIAQYVDVSVSGAHVTITQSDAVTNDLINDGTMEEITYNLKGASTDGSLTLGGSAKCTVTLNGLALTNPNGAPINITNGKRIDLSVKKDTENTLQDGTASSAKACLYCQGHLELKGKGVLNVYAYGSKAHGIKSGDYTEMKNCTVNILAATKDGVSCNEYFLMESGTLNISGVGDDGIQCDIDNDEGTPIAATDAADGGHEDEDTGNIYIIGGTINASITGASCKGIKSEGDMVITDGAITVSTSGGGTWDSDKLKTKASACLGADGNVTISGGTLSLTSTGAGGKGINADGTLTVDGGTTTIKTSGNAVVASSTGTLSVVTSSQQLDKYDSDYKSSPKGIKVDGAITVNDGIINVTTTGAGGEGIESKTCITFNGGQTYVSASDDGINASYNDDTKSLSYAGDMTINGGYIYCYSTGNDAMDTNGNFYIKGGLVYAIGSGNVEKSLDANTEEGKKLYISGGTVIAIGDLESGSSITNGTCKSTTSWSKNSWLALYNGGTLAAAFKTPSTSGNSQKLIVYTSSTPTLTSGVSVSGGTDMCNGVLNIGGTVSGGSSVTLSNYSSGGGGFGPGGGGGRW